MIELIRNTSLPPSVFCDLSPECEINIKKAVEFTLAFHPARSLLDSSGRLDKVAGAINELIFPSCDDEDFVELACATATAVASWEEVIKDDRTRKVLGRALHYFVSQKPLQLEKRKGQIGQHYAPFVSSTRHMLRQLSTQTP